MKSSSLMPLCALSMLLLGAPLPASAASGGELKRLCSGVQGSREVELCAAYVSGVVSTLKFVGQSKNTIKPIGCLPASMTGEEMIAITNRYLRENPHLLNRDGAGLVSTAFTTAYPCS